MDARLMIIFTLAVIICILVCVYIYNLIKLKFYKSRVDSSISVINDELENRYNLILETKQNVEKSTKKDIDFYKELENIKNTNITSYELDKKIDEALQTLDVIRNDHPKLEEKKEFKEVIRKIEESNTRITAAKSFYNKNNDLLVAMLKRFVPGTIGKLNKMTILPYYDTVNLFEEEINDIEE